jgi:hypothetical protein
MESAVHFAKIGIDPALALTRGDQQDLHFAALRQHNAANCVRVAWRRYAMKRCWQLCHAAGNLR